ncbi:MAG: hypothetical protein MJY62_06780, partial [Bacteroidales bacterium]|nr:hypothetical protein [Bacteroidales bacterium]
LFSSQTSYLCSRRKISSAMSISLFSIASSLHRGLPSPQDEPFIKEIEKNLGEDFDFKEDFATYDKVDNKIIYVRTGGSEEVFRSLGLGGEIRLLTSGKENSLAAAMEILSYININGGKGEILHGSADYIARRIRGEAGQSEGSSMTRPLPPVNLGGKRVGVIGAPSDWLISSEVDYALAERRLNVKMVDVPIDELIREVGSHDCDLRSFKGSEAVYEELKHITDKYRLDALTLRCFDLLDSIGNTGCLALARLNSEGITSSCEGDIPTLFTMMIAKEKTGCPGFQCNLSRITGDELLFAHCTVPLSMTRAYTYDTHFESGIGTAIKAELPLEEITIAKLSPDLENIAVIPGRILRNQSEANLCRTQIVVEAPGSQDYFLKHSFANHHVIIPGRLFI